MRNSGVPDGQGKGARARPDRQSGGKGRPAARATARPAPPPKYFEDDPNKNDRPSFHADGRKRRQRNVKERKRRLLQPLGTPRFRERFSESRERSSAPRGRSQNRANVHQGPRGRSDESRERSSAPAPFVRIPRTLFRPAWSYRRFASVPPVRVVVPLSRVIAHPVPVAVFPIRGNVPPARAVVPPNRVSVRSVARARRRAWRFSRREGGSSPGNSARRNSPRRNSKRRNRFTGRFAPKRSMFQEPKEDDGRVRLNKFIANCGICSRREADELISAGVITVNGEVVTELGTKVGLTDTIKYNNQVLRGERPVYLLLNKPKDYITTVDDPGKRHTVMELIANACKERVIRSVASTGTRPAYSSLRTTVNCPPPHAPELRSAEGVPGRTRQEPQPEDFERSERPDLEDGPIKVDDIAYTGEGRDRKVIGVELHSHRNRIVRRIFEHLHYEVQKLDRTVFAGLTKGPARGRWRFYAVSKWPTCTCRSDASTRKTDRKFYRSTSIPSIREISCFTRSRCWWRSSSAVKFAVRALL